MRHFSISDIESLTGIKAHTIRIWEQRYQLVAPKRTETNIRYYDDEDLCVFLNVATLNEHGYKISKISKMETAEIADLVQNLHSNPQNANAQIQQLCNAMMKMDDALFEDIINGYIETIGLEEAMGQILFPFLYKIGAMWQVGSINPAHEHFATHKIQQKIIEATYKVALSPKPDAKKYVLFLPPLELHELGLLFAQYLLRKHGQNCLYLGQNLPFDTLTEVVKFYQPDYAFTVLTTALPDANTDNMLSNLKTAANGTTLLVTGNRMAGYTGGDTDNLKVIKYINAFIQLIKS